MRVGLIAPPWVPVPPVAYGGTEQVIDELALGLAAEGHDVVLFATGDSTCPVTRRAVFDRPPPEMNLAMPECRHVQAAYEELVDCDVIHDHTTLGPIWAAAAGVRIPIVVTVHNPFTAESRPVLAWVARSASVTAISQSHRDSAPEIPVAAVIHHGVEPSRFPVGGGRGGYAVFIGRAAPEKGIVDAIRIARRAGVRLVVAAKARSPEERQYLERDVEPLLGPDVDFVGEVSPAERNALLADAVALVNPITWREPFGMVMIEAMACGTPVIAYPNGAAPEIVQDGVTGFLCHDVESGAAALRAAAGLRRQDCRAAVEGHFSRRRMTTEYAALYSCLVTGEPARRTAEGASWSRRGRSRERHR